MPILEKVETATDHITRYISLISLTGLLIIASATVLDILVRWLFNAPIVGLADTHSLFIAIIIAACFPLCIYKRGNISIRFLGSYLGPTARNLLDAFGYLVMAVIFALMGMTLWEYTDQLVSDGSGTLTFGWPVAPWWRVVTIIVFFCVPVAFLAVIQYLKAIKSKGSKTVIHEASSFKIEAEDE